MDRERRWTVGELAESGAEVLRRAGVEEARLDADLLLAEVLGCKRIEVYTRFDMPVEPEDRARFRDFVRRRRAREPLAYILGRRDFYESTFRVGPGVLVPRPETELLVDLARDWMKERVGEPLRILDLGTGSGCIALSLLRLFPEARALGVDLERDALGIATDNARRLGLEDRFEAREADMVVELAAAERPWDLILSNPPYVEERERGELAPEVVDHEPARALFSPGDSDHLQVRLLEVGRKGLAPGGLMAFELGTGGGRRLEVRARELEPEARCATHRDLAGRERVFLFARDEFPENWGRHLVRDRTSQE